MADTSTKRMSIEKARSVYWLRNNHRPLGELLDGGFLNESRLTWAAEKAYDPQLKAAAGVLLDWIRQTPSNPTTQPSFASDIQVKGMPVIEAPITVEQARETAWPFPPFKRQPMGALVDARQLSLKDLAYAIENAWDKRVHQAAIVLLAVCLNQVVEEPPPPVGPLHIISSGESYSERKLLGWTSLQGMFVGAVGMLLLGVLVLSARAWFINLTQPRAAAVTSPDGIVIAISLVIVLGLVFGAIALVEHLFDLAFDRTKKEMENARKGLKGEEQVVEMIRQNLDGNWTLFRNVVLPGRNQADMDAVLVGPPGVWVLEVKNFTGRYFNSDDRWWVIKGKKVKNLKKNPGRQAQKNAARLAGFFKADGIKQWVNPVVVWANREGTVKVKQPSVPVWFIERLPEEMGNLWQDRPMPEAMQARIVEKLTALCQQTAKANND